MTTQNKQLTFETIDASQYSDYEKDYSGATRERL